MIESIQSLIELFVSETKENGIGMLLLFGFWATCVIGFFSVVSYVFVMSIHNFIMKNINKVRSHFIKL